MIAKLIKKSLRNLNPYVSARSLYKRGILLDANENPFETALNRYPDPEYPKLKKALADYVGISRKNIFVGSGSDEILSLLGRLILDEDSSAIAFTPTYGMYKVITESCGARLVALPLDKRDFQIDKKLLYANLATKVKIIFICSPNNPTGNLIRREDILELLGRYDGLVVVDEAYIEFSFAKSLASEVKNYPNLVVLRTFSKAWGLAGARVGYCVAGDEIINYLNRLKLPYNLNSLSERVAMAALENPLLMKIEVKKILKWREKIGIALEGMGFNVLPSDANFLFVRFKSADSLVRQMAKRFGIIIRAFPQGFRISVGLPDDNLALINSLNKLI